ncbi:MAG TPA: 23S rRNA (pseudouridine(1915)-N(3))-methyltransferase RlmH [Thermohalobaculum sp.]|nr:23S rRNA (pseudouridine(1915)-N(3))-methyltransferase RlmH [Thermohalobaculum sp.]
MKVTVAAVGRLRRGPELGMVEHYLRRADDAGRALALGPFRVSEVDERKARSALEQSRQLADAAPEGAHVIALDERGKTLSSPQFAHMLATLRDSGTGEAVFLIGGAEGHAEEVRDRAHRLLSLGPMVWPHMLARVMLAEQLYRAVSILGNGPYHRG